MKILVAAHKPYQMPENDIYQPVFVGAALKDDMPSGYVGDNTGQNMSEMNSHFNELTALYWAKYNLQDEDILGLMHYRRYLGQKSSHDLADILTAQDIENALAEVDVLVPKARNYYIEDQQTHYFNAHEHAPFEAMKDVIGKSYPEYADAFDQVCRSTKAHLFNMQIMKQADFQSFTDFLFGILEQVETMVPYKEYKGQESRVFGFLSEYLLDTWMITNGKTYREYPLVTTEKTNWLDKGSAFLMRKFTSGKRKKTHF